LADDPNHDVDRRRLITSFLGSSAVTFFVAPHISVAAESDDFASIAARASGLSKELSITQPLRTSSMVLPTNQTAYDFFLPIAGVSTPFSEIIHQEFATKTAQSSLLTSSLEENNKVIEYRDPKIKAILVVNIKQDDPVARKMIPELISLATKYGRGDSAALAIVACPTDQGYFEPDTSQLIRLKLQSEYGFGINPNTIVVDKVNLLGTGAVPFWRWLQSTCRTPAGLGRITGNFEKFLIDGRTGLPLRRYPRKYTPLNIAEDIEAVISGKPLPPARANYLEEWRQAATDAERDTYRFEKGLNVFDQ
jgi:glutathione peroxidase